MATRKPTKKETKHTGSIYSNLFVMTAFGAGLAFALPTMLVLAVGLLPTLVALLVDVHPRKFAAWSVGFLNCAGLMPYLGDLWINNHTVEGAMGVLTDVVAWLVIYGAAAAGWMVYRGMPVVGGMILEIKAQGQIRRLRAERQKLIDEWGRETAAGRGG
ncbi:MAG: hypothetical protein V3S92_05995 [Alphaproteobacteria bacterium]